MSLETLEWLNACTLIGFTEKRDKHAWHYREDLQGAESNHYPGAIPVEDVNRRLFNWEAIESPVYFEVPVIGGDNDGGLDMLCDPTRKVIYRSDTHDVLGMFKESYQGHSYNEWLLENVGSILDSDLGIGSAGLLKNGAQAWVQVEMPDSIEAAEGIAFRPNLLATTSFDGTIVTTYKPVVTIVVCDNTRAAALGESGNTFKVKHSRHSGMKLMEAREALGVVHKMAEDFSAEVATLLDTKVSDGDWAKFLESIAPIPEEEGKGRTQAQNKQGEINRLYRFDDRCAPWTGTAFGVLQTINTFAHHSETVRGRGTDGMDADDLRAMRNAEKMVNGSFETLDRETYGQLMKVLA